MSKKHKKHKKKNKKKQGIAKRIKTQVREIRTEATIQAMKSAQKATSGGGLSLGAGILQLWRNYIDAIDRVVKEIKRSRKK